MQTTRGTSLTESTSSAEAGTPAAQPTQPAPEKAAVKPSMRLLVLLGAVAVMVIVADLLSKIAVVSYMTENETRNLIGRLLQITYTRNAGAAFSFGEGMTVVFALVAVAVAVAIIRTARSLRSLWWAITLGLLLGGALGNLGDRIFRSPGFLRGHVVDWIELPHWPVFNLADSAIVCGGVIAVILSARGIQVDGTHADHRHPAVTDDEPTEPTEPAEVVES